MSRKIIALLIIALLTACNPAATPEAATPVVVIDTPTSAPTVSLPTAAPTPTIAPPTATSTLTIKPTRTPTATPAAQNYTVAEGDTLLDIALKFDTTTEALAAANAMAEDDFLQIGQDLIIPTPEPTATTPAMADAATPAAQTEVIAAPSTLPTAPPSIPGVSVIFYTMPPVPTITHPANINPLTGLPVADPATLLRRPLMVRIGNDPGARVAQMGLNSADMVYEEITEWWVTRFSAIFLSNTPEVAGPIRSARLVSGLLGPQYQAAVAHSGGSDPVRWLMTQVPIANLDQLFHGNLFFHRPNEGWMTRAAFKPSEAHAYMAAKGMDAPVRLIGFQFSETAPARGAAAPNIFIPYPRATSFTQWSYDPASGKYLRSINDVPLFDAADGSRIAAANVIVYFAAHEDTDIVEDSNGGTSIQISINGIGPAWFFRDGKLTKGTWQDDGARTPYFALADGSPYPLKPGNTWVELVPTTYKIGLTSADEASSKP
jgi:LysM repeat protein